MNSLYRTVLLGDVLAQFDEYVYNLEDIEYPKLSVKLYGKGCVVQGEVLGSNVKMKRHQLARAGQVIVSEIWAKKGAIGVVPVEGHGALVTSHFFLFDIEETVLSRQWFLLLSRANYFADELAAVARGTTGYASVRPRQFLDIKIPLPPLDVQKRVVAALDAIADRLDNARQVIASFSLEAQYLRTAQIKQMIKSLESKFNSVTLESVTQVVGGGTPSKSNLAYWDGTIPWVTPKDMKSLVISDSQDKVTTLGVEKSVAKLINPEAVLVVVRSNILARTVPIAVTTVPVVINQDLKAFIPDDQLLARYLAVVLQSKEDELLSFVKRSVTMRSIRLQDFLATKIPLPPIDEQEEVVRNSEFFYQQQLRLEEDVASFQAALDSLEKLLINKALQNGDFAAVPLHEVEEYLNRQKLYDELVIKTLDTPLVVAPVRMEVSMPERGSVENADDLIQLLQQLVREGRRRVTPERLWQLSGLADKERGLDRFYEYLKQIQDSLVDVRDGNYVYLEVKNEN